MDDYKKIRAGKHKHKGRYKDQSKVIPKKESTSKEAKSELSFNVHEDKTFSKRGIVNNWDRYEKNIDDITISDEDVSSKDFKLLADAPISKGNYFQFKQDKQFFPLEDISIEVNQLFNLDLNLISAAMETIPLYDLVGIDKNMFSIKQIADMEKTATKNLEVYNKFLESYTKVESHFLNTEVPGVSRIKENISMSHSTSDMHCTNVNIPNVMKNETEDLEDWLDDILN